MSPRSPQVLVIGDVVSDVVAMLSGPPAAGSDTPATIRVTGGGQAANTAAWLAREGVPVALVAAVGDDAAGRDRTAELTAAGVTCAVRRVPATSTGTVLVLVGPTDTGGADRSMITDRGANRHLSAADVDAALARFDSARHLHLSGYVLLDEPTRAAGRHALRRARERGLTTSVDAASAAPLRQVGAAAFRAWLPDVGLLLANADEAAVLAGPATGTTDATGALARGAELARRLAGAGRSAVVKLGAAGAVWSAGDGSVVSAAAPRSEVVDPTGAGDAFAAGLLAARLSGADRLAALRAAARCGAQAVAAVGARGAVPSPPGDRTATP